MHNLDKYLKKIDESEYDNDFFDRQRDSNEIVDPDESKRQRAFKILNDLMSDIERSNYILKGKAELVSKIMEVKNLFSDDEYGI